MALLFVRPLTEMSTGKSSGADDKALSARGADDSLASLSRLSGKCWILDFSVPCGPPRPATGIALLTYYTLVRIILMTACLQKSRSSKYESHNG
jgi:hypothetical protein